MGNLYVVYVKTNTHRYITDVNSSAFLTDTTDWKEIDSGYGDKYHHAQGNYFEKPIMTDGGAYRYKLIDGKLEECTLDEIEAQKPENVQLAEPTQLDRVEAQSTYTAMIVGTLLPEV